MLCPHCRDPLPQRSRYCPKCGFLCISEQHRSATQSVPPTTSARPQATAVPRAQTPPPQPTPHAAMHQQPPKASTTQHEHNCPKCGASIDPELGRCTSCGLLYGSKHRVMQQQTTPTPPARPPLAPRPQSSTGQQPPGAYGTRPQYNNPKLSPAPPSFGQRPSYSSSGAMPHGGIPLPIPRVATVAASAAPMPASPPLSARPYPYQTVPPMPIERGISDSGRRGLIRIVTTLLILIVCFFIGSGIYYIFTQTGTPPLPNSTTDTTPPSIQSVSISSITETGAVITWRTDKPATSQVIVLDPNGVSTQTEPVEALSTSHSVTLSGLKPNTTYHYTVISKDANGNEAPSTTNQTFETPPAIPVGYQKGNRAPGFTLKNLNEQDVTLSAFRGKIVMVNFWATWCDPCVGEMPHIQAVSGSWSGGELVILAIHVKDRAATAQSWINDKGYTFPVLLDSEGKVQTLYGITNTIPIPRTFFIDRDGIIREVKDVSFSNQAEIESILKSL